MAHSRLRGLALNREFEKLLEQHDRIAVVGGPKTGKSTLCRRCVKGRPLFGTDTYKREPWKDQPAHILAMCSGVSKFVVEGVQVARALRGSKDGTAKQLEVDCIVYLTEPRIERLPGQERMAKGVATILRDYIAKNPDHPPIAELT